MTHDLRAEWPLLLRYAFLALMFVAPPPCLGVQIRVDYTQDGSGFFSASTQQGLAARSAVNAAAAFYSDILQDSLTPLSVPPRFFGSFNGTADYFLEFANPNDPSNEDAVIRFADYSIAQNEYVIFAGGAPFSGTQIASAGLGGANMAYTLVPSDIPAATKILEDFDAEIASRGQTSGFAHWGGTMSFDNDGSTSWNTDLSRLPSVGESDLYSVALHEMGHVLGLRRSTMLEFGLIDASNRFTGTAAMAEFGGPIPLQTGGSHWAEGAVSVVYNGATIQETLYDPSFNSSTRKELTLLDAAGLSDLGWSVAPSDAMAGDFNHDGTVDAADYSAWRQNFGGQYATADYLVWRRNYGQTMQPAAAQATAPEPPSFALLAQVVSARVRRRR